MLGFNDTSTLKGHFVSPPRHRGKRDRRGKRETEENEGKKEQKSTEERQTYAPSTLPTGSTAGLAQL